MRKSEEDWLKTGIDVLRHDGLGGLTIENMAHKLRLTKGSFYHHFANIDDFKNQLIAYWADQHLSADGPVPKQPAAALALLDSVMAGTFGPATGPEVAIRTWAQQDKRVRARVEKVDEARRALIAQAFLTLNGDVIQAQRMADILFTMLIGSIMALPPYSPERVSILYAEFKRLYGLKNARSVHHGVANEPHVL